MQDQKPTPTQQEDHDTLVVLAERMRHAAAMLNELSGLTAQVAILKDRSDPAHANWALFLSVVALLIAIGALIVALTHK